MSRVRKLHPLSSYEDTDNSQRAENSSEATMQYKNRKIMSVETHFPMEILIRVYGTERV